jgi:hypothetical protein
MKTLSVAPLKEITPSNSVTAADLFATARTASL